METLYFSAPYNNDPQTLDEIFRLNRQSSNKISEIYLAGPQQYSGAGRIMPEISFKEFCEVVGKIHDQNMQVNLVLNSTCEGDDWYSPQVLSSTMEYIGHAHHKLGVESITIANPLYVKEARRHFPQIEICASVLSDIDSVDRAILFKKAGANTITPDVNINRNLGLLKKIKEYTSVKLKLMVNEGCLYRCPFRKFHFNYISHRSRRPDAATTKRGEQNVFSQNCIQVSKNDYSQILKSRWIRPEDVRRYAEITTFFKIVGRTSSKNMIIRAVKAYLEESYEGDLMELMAGNLYSLAMSYFVQLDNKSLDRNAFFETTAACNEDCDTCTFCPSLAKKLVRTGVPTRTKLEDAGMQLVTSEQSSEFFDETD